MRKGWSALERVNQVSCGGRVGALWRQLGQFWGAELGQLCRVSGVLGQVLHMQNRGQF